MHILYHKYISGYGFIWQYNLATSMFNAGNCHPTATISCDRSPNSARDQAQQLLGPVHCQHALVLLHSGTHCSDLQSAGTVLIYHDFECDSVNVIYVGLPLATCTCMYLDVGITILVKLLYSQKYWQSLNLAV